jgi:predicted O-methyltransferase YrrM
MDRLRGALGDRAAAGYSPLCDAPLAPPDAYRRIWAEAQRVAYPIVDRFEEAAGASIDPAWFHQLALLTQVTIKRSDICYQHGRLLYAALSRYLRTRASQHLTIVETGTARGFSALCMARALDDAGASGKILTFDVLPHDVRILWNCVLDAEGARTRAELLQDYAALLERHVVFHGGDSRKELSRMSFPRVNFAFLDSIHEYDAVMAEFAAIRGRQKPGDMIFFDDYSADAYPGVVKAADEICREYGYSATVLAASARRRYLIAEKQ